jgi:hypothetical protein
MKLKSFPKGKYLYHGTSSDYISSIKKYGISAQPPQRTFGFSPKGVCASGCLEEAIVYGYQTTKTRKCHKGYPNKICILKINKVPVNTRITFEETGDFIIHNSVPPSCFKVLPNAKIKKQVSKTLELD